MRITVGGLKGGIGKTTTAVHLGAALALHLDKEPDERPDEPARVLVVDADPQSQSLYDWAQTAIGRGESLPFDVQPWATDDLAVKVRGMLDRYDHLVIDVGGETARMFRAALSVAPELVIPVRANLIELRRIPATIETATEVQHLTGTPVYPRVLLCSVQSSAGDEDAARKFLANPRTADGEPLPPIPTMQARVRLSVVYSRAFGHALGDVGDYSTVLRELRDEIEGDEQ